MRLFSEEKKKEKKEKVAHEAQLSASLVFQPVISDLFSAD